MSLNISKPAVVIVAAIVLMVALAVVLVSGSQAYDGPVDALGNRTSFSSVPDKIISTAPSITETLMAMGYIDRIVAVSNNCDQPEIVSLVDQGKIKRVGSYNNPSQEEIIATAADVVLMGLYSRDTSGAYTNLREAGLKAVMLHGGESRSEIYLNLDILGAVFSDSVNTDGIKQGLIQTFSAVQLRGEEATTTYRAMINLGYGWSSVYGAGSSTFGDDMLVMANNKNVLAGVSGWKAISNELLLGAATEPQVIIVLMQGDSGMDQAAYEAQMDNLKADGAWGETSAVKDDRVHFLYGSAASAGQRTSPNLADFSKLVLMITHPELFDGFVVPGFIGPEYEDLIAANW